MTQERKNKILSVLQNGGVISVDWKGTNRSGRLVYSLEGISKLRESEVKELRKEKIIETFRREGIIESFKPYHLKKI